MPELHFRNIKTDRRYRVVRFDKEAGTVVLVGTHGVEFEEQFDKDTFVQMGYVLERSEGENK